MDNKPPSILKSQFSFGNIVSCLFALLVLLVGLINTFWGNDPGFGIFLILLSIVYFPPVNTMTRNITGFSIPVLAKIVLGIFIIWASVGVGELSGKIELMMMDLR
jgi:hypothetical protein